VEKKAARADSYYSFTLKIYGKTIFGMIFKTHNWFADSQSFDLKQERNWK